MKERGVITESASARLDWLTSQQRREVRDSKLLRTAEEAFIALGVEAQAQILRQIFAAKCEAALGDLVNQLDLTQIQKFAKWVETMSADERDRLKRLTAAHSQHGPSYRRHLADNETWIRKAERQSMNLDAWFSTAPHDFGCQEKSLSIAKSGDLYDLFMMGEYFQTCLSFDGINEMAVLTNATDANKQVLFVTMLDEAGKKQVIARKLLAISADFKLIGYSTYFRGGPTTEAMHKEIDIAINAYCGVLAARCGLELANEGAPEPIKDHFWYDDGLCVWSKEAMNARREWLAQNAPPFVVTMPIETWLTSPMPYAMIAMER
jgi:hypothetical protein